MIIFNREQIKQIKERVSDIKRQYNAKLERNELSNKEYSIENFLNDQIVTNMQAYKKSLETRGQEANAEIQLFSAIAAFIYFKNNVKNTNINLDEMEKSITDSKVTKESLDQLTSFINLKKPMPNSFIGIDEKGEIKENVPEKENKAPKSKEDFLKEEVEETEDKDIQFKIDSKDKKKGTYFLNNIGMFVKSESVRIMPVSQSVIDNNLSNSIHGIKSTSQLMNSFNDLFKDSRPVTEEEIEAHNKVKGVSDGDTLSLETMKLSNSYMKKKEGALKTAENVSEGLGYYMEQRKRFERRGFTKYFWFLFKDARQERNNLKSMERKLNDLGITKDILDDKYKEPSKMRDYLIRLNNNGVLQPEKAYGDIYAKEKDTKIDSVRLINVSELEPKLDTDLNKDVEDLDQYLNRDLDSLEK